MEIHTIKSTYVKDVEYLETLYQQRDELDEEIERRAREIAKYEKSVERKKGGKNK